MLRFWAPRVPLAHAFFGAWLLGKWLPGARRPRFPRRPTAPEPSRANHFGLERWPRHPGGSRLRGFTLRGFNSAPWLTQVLVTTVLASQVASYSGPPVITASSRRSPSSRRARRWSWQVTASHSKRVGWRCRWAFRGVARACLVSASLAAPSSRMLRLRPVLIGEAGGRAAPDGDDAATVMQRR
jgi:hypothetical protein